MENYSMKRAIYFMGAFLSMIFLSAPALAQGEATADYCPVCGLCPAPFGICLFLIIIAFLAVLLLVLLLSNAGKRCPLCKNKCKRKDYICSKCGYDFESGLQSTLNIRVADSPELMALRDEYAAKTPQMEAIPASRINSKPKQEEAPATDTAPASRTCPVCGAVLPAQAMFCGKCGRRLEQ